MFTALLRKARSDVAGRPLQTGLVFVVVALATAILTAAVTTQVTVDRAFTTRFDETNGAHVWFSYAGDRRSESSTADLQRIASLDEVAETSGVIPYISRLPAVLDDGTVDLRLHGLPSVPPAVGRPVVARGRWLAQEGKREIVVDYGLARERGLDVGDRLEILAPGGAEVFQVVGLSVEAGLSYPHTYADSLPYASSFVLPAAIDALDPNRELRAWEYGVRIDDAENAWQFVDKVGQAYPDGRAPAATTWDMSKAEVTDAVSLYAAFIGLIGMIAVGVAAFVIVSVVGGNALAHVRDVGLLKAVGFTPRQVTALLLVEHVAVGLVAALIGTAVGYLAAPLVLRATGNVLGTAPSPVFDLPLMAAIVIGVTLVIALTAFAPAWRGGRVSTVQALNSGSTRTRSGASRTAKLAALLRLPAVVTVGVKDVFNRPVRSVLTVGALTVAVMMAVFGLAMELTLRGIVEDPRLSGGAPYQITITRSGTDGGMPATDVSALLDGHPQVESHFGELELLGDLDTGVHGGDGAEVVRLGAVDPAYADLSPYLSDGRLFAGPGEAIITGRAASERGLGIGDSLTFVIGDHDSAEPEPETEGRALVLQVVGIYVGDDLRIMTGLDTVRGQLGAAVGPTRYLVKAGDGVDPEALKLDLLNEAGGAFSVSVLDAVQQTEETAGYIRPPLYALALALFAISVVSVLITLLFLVRERYRDFAILKTVGFTPRQVAVSVVSGAFLMAAPALVVGVPLGLLLTRAAMDFIGNEAEIGTPFGTMPGPVAIVLLVPVILLVAALGAALPARRAAGITVRDALRFE